MLQHPHSKPNAYLTSTAEIDVQLLDGFASNLSSTFLPRFFMWQKSCHNIFAYRFITLSNNSLKCTSFKTVSIKDTEGKQVFQQKFLSLALATKG